MENKKNNFAEFDFIIVGQGIAGSVLAISLIKSGYTICLINQPNLSLSSRVAAGIWNPVVFKRLTKSWLADDLVPELISFYGFFEKETTTQLLHHRHIIKPFTEEQEKNLWLKKSQTGNQFLDTTAYTDLKLTEKQIISSYSKVLQAGNLDIPTFLKATKNYIQQTQTYIEEGFNYGQLKIENNQIEYNQIVSKQIVFCDGYLIQQNPFFNWIPMKPAKGETLTISCDEILLQPDILNKGIFIMPLGNKTYKIGATYEWENLNDDPTEKGRSELEQKLNAIIQSPYTILKQEAGVRPSVIDRRPVVGPHPDHNNIYCFNGFGTKAVMLAPYFAKQLIHFIQNGTIINPEVDPIRFKK